MLGDNLCYYLRLKGQDAIPGIFVDISEPAKAIAFLETNSIKVVPSHILTTHKHNDHSGGNIEMRELYPSLEIFGGLDDNVPGATTAVKDGDIFELNGIRITCFHTPCHTRGHILYYCEPVNPDPCYMGNEKVEGYSVVTGVDKCVFTGDTIFVGGCGRFFEGSAAEMAEAMAVMRDRLP